MFRQIHKISQQFQQVYTTCLMCCALLLLLSTSTTYAQCENAYGNPGNQVLSEARKCAPNEFEWQINYDINSTISDDRIKFEVVWGDGSDHTVGAPVAGTSVGAMTRYSYKFEHEYNSKDGECNYSPTAYLVIDGQRCTSSNQTQNVTVWDVDNKNGGIHRIHPPVRRVCWGTPAEVVFTDASQWNCTPASGENDDINNIGRWVQWIYHTGDPGNIIPGVTVNNNAPVANFRDGIEYLPGPIVTPNSQSMTINVPGTTTQADTGKVFQVKLRNWNVCNPYDANMADGLPPVSLEDGDNAPIETTAYIIIVNKADAQFTTHNAQGAARTEFCINEPVHFKDITAAISGANYAFSWRFFDDAAGTTAIGSSTLRNPTFSFQHPGIKTIELTVRDNNSAGQCAGVIRKQINVVPIAQAKINTTDENDVPLGNLCFSDENNAFKVKFDDVSTGFDAAHATWQWVFYHLDGTTYVEDSRETGSGTQRSFTQTYTGPGSYKAVLTAGSDRVDCTTEDVAFVHIYQQPRASFTASEVCLGENTTFKSTASLFPVVNEDAIQLYEWDFDNDGIFELNASNADAFSHTFTAAGTYRVSHRVTTVKGQCSHTVTQDVVVKASPIAAFSTNVSEGCSPLVVNFTPEVAMADQPADVEAYIWHIRDLKTNTENTVDTAPADMFEAPAFVNTQSSMVNHAYEVWLEAQAANGCSTVSGRTTITVYPGPSSEFIITNLTGADNNCAPRNYAFQATAATQALLPQQYHWTITDEASNSTIVQETVTGSPDFAYVLPNETNAVKRYRVHLLAEKAADCQLVSYVVEAEQKGLVYHWNISPQPVNNPDMSRDKFEVIYAKTPGSSSHINIQLKTTNLAGCESMPTEETLQVVPQENINASFTVTPSIMEIPNSTVQINPVMTHPDWTYAWDFGDGATSAAASPGTHTYALPGEYDINLVVSGAYCHQVHSSKVIIRQTLPVVDFDYSQIEGCLPLTVYFYNHTQYAEADTYFWDFGDGSTSTEENPTYTYTVSGIYTVTLQASNSLNVVVTREKDMIIDLSQGPKADFNIRLAKAYLPDQDIMFSNLSQRATSYFWDFGDGNTSTVKDPVHQYQQTGHYDITLTIQNALGCTDTLTKSIFVEPLMPEVDFAYEPPTGCRPLTVQFRNLSRYAAPGTYRWSFGEGQGVSTEENPTYTYYEPGLYTVTLEASNSIGVTVIEKKEFSVEVYDNPIAAFNLRPAQAFLGENIYLVNLSIKAKNFTWDFGDGTISHEAEPVHQYNAPGTYDITLIAENEYGCSDTLTKVSAIIIEQGGKIQVPNAFTPSTAGPGGGDGSNAGKNDVFLPVFEGVTSFHMMIYNRWGELLFESRNKAHGWDGYYKGRLSPKDVYVYKLELRFSDGRSNTLAGDVTLLR